MVSGSFGLAPVFQGLAQPFVHQALRFGEDLDAFAFQHAMAGFTAQNGEFAAHFVPLHFLDQQGGFGLIPYRTAGRVLINLPILGALTWRDGALQWISENQVPVKGKVLLRIPYVGYIKLLLFLQIQAPAGCDSVLQKPA